MTTKIAEYGKTVWNHKKKIIFFGGLAGWGISYLNTWNNEQILRSSYARKAESHGATLISGTSDYVPPKFHVFIDKSDNLHHKNLASFQKNVLPLLILAGFDVRELNAANAEELRQLSHAADVRNCAGIAVIGSQRFALPPVLSGLFLGQSNGHEARTSLAVFDPADRDDVDARCRKAMRIINGQRDPRHVYSTKVYTKDSEDNALEKAPESSVLRVANFAFGWFDFVREKEPKFWWFAGLSDRIAFTWYFLKNYPQQIPLNIRINEYCKGCRKCVTSAAKDSNEERNEQRWWQHFIGRKEQPGDKRRREFAQVINENCGSKTEIKLDALDLSVQNLNDGVYGGLKLRTIDPFTSRWQAIWHVWSNWNRTKNPENFFSDKSTAQYIEMQFEEALPDLVRQTKSVANLDDKVEESEQISKIVVETLPNIVQMY